LNKPTRTDWHRTHLSGILWIASGWPSGSDPHDRRVASRRRGLPSALARYSWNARYAENTCAQQKLNATKNQQSTAALLRLTASPRNRAFNASLNVKLLSLKLPAGCSSSVEKTRAAVLTECLRTTGAVRDVRSGQAVRVAQHTSRGPARHPHSVASERISPVLAVEVQTAGSAQAAERPATTHSLYGG
jgi:hypothetical protein